MAAVLAIGALVTYYSNSSKNPVTGETQRLGGITQEQEIALGLQATPELIQQFGGRSRDTRASGLVRQVGQRILEQSDARKGGYRYEFHLLDDDQTINAFALPGGQVFITEALMRQLKTEGQLAGVLGHEIGHVVGRHGAEHIAKAQLTQGLTGAAILATYDPDNPGSIGRAQLAAIIGQLITLKHGRDDELESDRLGVRFMAQAGYDPRSMVHVMEVLKKAGAGGQMEFFSTHPDPANRIEKIKRAIEAEFPNGLPSGLKP